MTIHLLPTVLVRYIFLDLYFPWVLDELKTKIPEDNRFIAESGDVTFETFDWVIRFKASFAQTIYRRYLKHNSIDGYREAYFDWVADRRSVLCGR
jgi:hypothetical protein